MRNKGHCARHTASEMGALAGGASSASLLALWPGRVSLVGHCHAAATLIARLGRMGRGRVSPVTDLSLLDRLIWRMVLLIMFRDWTGGRRGIGGKRRKRRGRGIIRIFGCHEDPQLRKPKGVRFQCLAAKMERILFAGSRGNMQVAGTALGALVVRYIPMGWVNQWWGR